MKGVVYTWIKKLSQAGRRSEIKLNKENIEPRIDNHEE